MSLNRHSSSRRKFNQSKKRRRKSSEASVNYESLEERRLLAVDVGLNLNTEQFGAPPNLAGAVGPNHVVTVTNQSFKVLDKVTGDILVNKPVTDFWRDRGADVMPGVSVSDEVLADGDSATNTRVVYDADTRRWFITSVGNRDIYSGIDGNQHAVLLGMSRTSNPTLDWYSVSYGYDVDADPTTGDQFYDGGFPAIGGASSGVNLAVDDNSVIVSVNSPSPFAPPEVWTFNKFEQLVRPGVPGIGSDSFGVSASVVAAAGNNHQWGTDVTGTVAGTFGLVAPAEGDTLVLTELTDTDTAGGAVAQANVAIAVDPYEAPPEFIRQEFDPDIVNGGTELSASIQRLGNSLWATHAILGSGNGSNPDGGVTETSAIRWYEIDLDTKTVKQSGTIDHPQYNYIYPSIAVTEAGHVAISYTAAGVGENAGDGLFPSLAVSVGYNNGGNIIMEESRILKDGEGGYFDGRGNRWGNYASTVADPNDPTKAWVFGYWADDSVRSNGQIQAVEISLIGHSPEIVGDANPNVMVVRRSALDNAMIEVEIDGTVVNTYTETMLHSITLNGMGGDDTFIVDTVNGELEFLGGVEVIGDGDDTFVASTLENTTWELGLDGGGQAAIGNDFPPPCDEPHPDEQVVNLNFEADSLWFDDTAYNQNGYATFGDALRGELQLYFDNTIIPLFEGSFTVTLDITDNEVDSLATSEAFGYGFHDLNGENVWAASPWSIMTGRGDSNGVDESDGMINYNLDLSRFGGDQQALLDNITGGLTRSQYFRVLGMESFIPNETQNFDPRGNRDVASVMDLQYFDINDAAVVGNYDANDSTFEVLNYTTNANWAGDGSGLYFMGVSDTGTPMPLSVNSNTELIDFETIASSLAGTSRDGSFNDIVEQDRAFLRGLGFSLSPVTPPELSPGFDVVFTGIDEVQAGDGTDYFCIGSSNIDIMVSSGLGNDTFNVTGLGVGALNLFGEGGDDTYEVVFSSSGVITIIDSVGTENDTLIGKGTSIADEFIFDVNGVKVNSGLLIYVGIENATFDGLGDDDVFEVKAEQYGIIGLTGGEGVDTFIDSSGLDQQLAISVDDPVADPVDRLSLDLTGSFVDAYTADEVERFVVDGTFVIDGVNGTPTVAGGLNLIGDGDETLVVESALDAGWMISGDGSGDLTMDVEPLNFTGLESIVGTTGINTVDVTNTSTDLEITTREGADVFNIENVGPGIVTVNSGDADDVFNIINSGGGVFLMGEVGDDSYNVDLTNPGGLITIRDSVGSENDSLSALGTAGDDVFIFDGTLVDVNGVQIDHEGVENVSYDGLAGDDIFEIRSAVGGDVKDFTGGEGNDLFIVNDMGAGANGNQLRVSVADPSGAVNQLQLDVSSVITDTFFADTIENLSVDGLYLIDGVNGTPTVAGGLNLLGDGDERLTVESALDAAWTIDGDGAGGVTMDVETMTFNGLERIIGTTGVDTFDVTNTSTDLDISTRDGADVFNIENVGTGFVVGNGGEDDDEFNIIDSGGDVLLRGQAGDDEFTLSDNSSRANGTVDLEGGDGEDSFLITSLRLNSSNRLTGNAGDDSITMDYSSNGALIVKAGGGNDEFFVEGTGSGFIDLRGEVGDDTYYVNSVDPAAGFEITDSVNAENDKLVATGTEFDDVFDIGGDTETTILNGHQWSIIGIEEYSIDGLGGNDVFNVTTTDMFTGVINLSGNDGADSFVVNESGSGIVNLNGDAGDDSYTVHFKPNTNVTITDSVGSENDRFFGFGTENADVFEIDQNAPVVNGGMVVMTGVESEEYDGLGGDDTFNVHSTIGDSRFKGGDDADTFNIDMTSDGNVFMGQAGTDVFNVATSSGDAEFYGGDGVDGFYVAETTGNGEFFGGNDADYFSINLATGVSKFFGEAGEDLFDIVNHGPMGASGAIEVDGGADRNRLEVLGYQTKTNMVVVSKDRITGMSAVPIVYSASGSFSVENGIGGIELTGSDNHSDGFNVNNLLPTHTLNMIGGGGNDRFTVSQGALGGVSADGEEGSDLYQYSMGSNNNRFLFALDSGVVGSDRLIAYLTNGDDTLSLSGEAFAVQTDNLMFNENYESLFVSARGGNDEITVNSVPVNFVRIIGGAGDDIIDVNNYEQVGSLLVNGDAGDDTIDIESGTVSGNFTAFGGTGDDSFLVSKASYGNAYIDGQEGSDNYEIQIADRSSRLVVARDSGVVGVDNLDVYGTVVGDFVTFRSGVMLTPQQSILYTDKTETMNLFTEGLDDNVTVYGLSSPVTNIMTESGKDLVHVRSSFGPATSKVLNIDTGSNDDYVLVSGVGADTTTTINTGVGNDNVTLGSSLSANVGNLNDLYGTIDISMGLGNDRIYMNDVGKVASADYEVGAGFLRSTPGGPNSFFAGITYDNTVETLRLDTTNYRNEVLVTPSSSTAFSFFGGGGLNIIELTGDADDDGRQFSGQDGGVGSWSFSNGSRDVFFSDYFIG